MPIAFGLFLLIIIYAIYKLLVSGFLWNTILFFAGWIGIYVLLQVYSEASHNTAITLGQNYPVSWAALIPTIICTFALLCKKVG